VATEIYYPLSLHQQVCFRDLGYREGDFPESEKAAREVLALPVHSALTGQDVDYVSEQIRAFYA
jgi:dTDP-4-amino-4,6-dideoxygalactose transaminase